LDLVVMYVSQRADVALLAVVGSAVTCALAIGAAQDISPVHPSPSSMLGEDESDVTYDI
jgi:hypothetical protein